MLKNNIYLFLLPYGSSKKFCRVHVSIRRGWKESLGEMFTFNGLRKWFKRWRIIGMEVNGIHDETKQKKQNNDDLKWKKELSTQWF